MLKFEYPHNEELDQLAEGVAWARLDISKKEFRPNCDPKNPFSFKQLIDCEKWQFHLINRLGDVYISYVMAQFYFSKGIPDKPSFLSPGQNGESFQFFPQFEDHHFARKAQFDYYVDVFYYKLFSACDTVGHILKSVYDLSIKKVYFGDTLEALAKIQPSLYVRLKEVADSRGLREARKCRHAITHDSPPNEVGTFVTSTIKNGFEFGIGKYTSCEEFIGNMKDALAEFAKFLAVLEEFGVIVDKTQKKG